MAIFYREGEEKIRPGIYQRYSNVTSATAPGAQDGICAIPIRASWGPLGSVVSNAYGELTKNYGTGTYDAEKYTVPAAQEMFEGGATTVYTYRLGTGGKKASLTLGENLTATAKYPGAFETVLSVQPKLGSDTKKEVEIYAGGALKETFEFEADGENEPANLAKACKNSKYIEFTATEGAAGAVENVPAASGALTGGEDPSVTNEDYSRAFEALEPYFYNVIALDINDDESLSKSLLLQSYLDNAYKFGKFAIAVVGETSEVSFEERLKHAAAFNDEKIVYLGSGWTTASGEVQGALAICRTAGVIAATPANQSIVHTAIKGAAGLLESFTYAQYEEAIKNGVLMPSVSSEGVVWYDSGVNTLIKPEENQDDGWKKIRRTRIRMEMFDRIDRALQPKVGRVNCDSDGIGDVIQTGQRVLDTMITERKVLAGAAFTVDTYAADSAWFIISADDIDSLEKIYLHYQFRFTPE